MKKGPEKFESAPQPEKTETKIEKEIKDKKWLLGKVESVQKGLINYIAAMEEAEKSGIEVKQGDFYEAAYLGTLMQKSEELKHSPGHHEKSEVPIFGEVWVPVTVAGGQLDYYANHLNNKITKEHEGESK